MSKENAIYDKVNQLFLFNENVVQLWPLSCAITVTLASGAAADAFGLWAEITASDASTLSQQFAVNSGFISEVMVRGYTRANEIYILEVGYNLAPTIIIGRCVIYSDWTYFLNLRSARIPVGSLVYYRMRQTTGGPASLLAYFRYYWI
jgi:hypothetical protein